MAGMTELLIVGAGPSGSTAAIYAARAGYEVTLIDASGFPRDKTCGDGLTPRAMHQLRTLGLDGIVSGYHNKGLKLHGYGGNVTAPWAGHYGDTGSAMPRTQFDAALVDAAIAAGATFTQARATSVTITDGRIVLVETDNGEFRPDSVIIADGVRSPVGKLVGRRWHRGEVYGIAARSYASSPFHDEPWMHSHVELRDSAGEIQPGYGWIFPLGNGDVNIGCGALSTNERPAKINTKKLLHEYAAQVPEWQLGEIRDVTSAMLPMGGAVTGVAGLNWMLIGDAAAMVNPLNGEGIDYGMETAGLAVEMLSERDYLGWPTLLREHYGRAFSLARTAARLLTYPQFLPFAGPIALRGPLGAKLMPAAARLMGNLITEEDTDLIARAWRLAGGATQKFSRAPLWS